MAHLTNPRPNPVDSGDVIEVALDARNAFGMTPLHVAAAKGELGALNELMAMGAAVDPTDPEGATPLFWATERGHAAAVSALASAQCISVVVWEKYSRAPHTSRRVSFRLNFI